MASQQRHECVGVHIACFGLGVFHLVGPAARVRLVLPGFGRSEQAIVVTALDMSELKRFGDIGWALKWTVGYCGGTRSDLLSIEEMSGQRKLL